MSADLLTASPVPTAAGWTMLHLMWVGSVIGLTASLVRRIFRSARPETRYGVALLCLLAMSVSPALIFTWVVEAEPGARTLATVFSDGLTTTSPLASESDPMPRGLPPVRELALDRFDGALPRSRLDSLVPFLTWFWLGGSPLGRLPRWSYPRELALIRLATSFRRNGATGRQQRRKARSKIPQLSLGLSGTCLMGITDWI